MKKATKIILLVSAGVVLLGCVMAGVAFAFGARFNNNVEYVTHSVEQDFKNVSISTNADVKIKASPDGKCYAICTQSEKITFTLGVEGETLVLNENDERKWYNYIGINFDEPRNAVLYLPEGIYAALSVQNTNGSIRYETSKIVFESAILTAKSGNIDVLGDADTLVLTAISGEVSVNSGNLKSLNISTQSGEVELSGVNVGEQAQIQTDSADVSFKNGNLQNLSISTKSGEIELENVVASEKMQIESKSGEISIEMCDAGEIVIESSSGEVEAILLSDKLFNVKTSSGRTRYPASVKDGGICNVTTKSGNVEIRVAR